MSNRRTPTQILDPLIPLSDGHWVNERVANLVDTIRDYYDGLDVYWDPNHAPDEPEFKIVEHVGDKKFIVMVVKDQASFDGDVLARIIAGDNRRGDVLDMMDARNKAAQLLWNKEAEEKLAEAKDVAKHVVASPLNKYVINKNLTIRDYGNRTR